MEETRVREKMYIVDVFPRTVVFQNKPKTHWHVPTYRWYIKWLTDINSINLSHVEAAILMTYCCPNISKPLFFTIKPRFHYNKHLILPTFTKLTPENNPAFSSIYSFQKWTYRAKMTEACHETGWNTGELEYPPGRRINLQIEVTNVESIISSLKKENYSLFRRT